MKINHLHSAVLVLATCTFPFSARADLSGTATLSAGTALSLDTGTTASSGGDILFTATGITFQGAATGFNLGPLGASGFSAITVAVLEGIGDDSALPIPLSSLVVNDVFAVQTNGGNAAKVLVTASSSTSITLQYTTFGAAGTPSGPTITGVTNNYSYIPSGFPNSGISPSSIFVIFGTGMANAPSGTVTLESSAGSGLPTSLAGASLSVTVGGKTVTPAMYYALPTAIAAVLPAATPTGTGTLTVTYNGTASNAFTIQVAPSAMGLDTYFGTGSGLVTATNATTGALFNYTNSAAPGQTIVLWGSGLGADPADSDSVFTTSPHAVSVPLQVYFGGIAGNVLYAGSSGYPGLNQINVTIPPSVAMGCNISVVAVIGNSVSSVSSNFGTLSINQGGGECSDAIYGSTGGQFGALSGKGTVKFGDLFLAQFTTPDATGQAQTANIADALFESVSGASFSASSSTVSLGSCIVNLTVSSSGSGVTINGLDAGSISLAGPAGSYPLTSETKGEYLASLPTSAITTDGGTFTFAGTGGADIGSFSASVVVPNPILSWTNQPSDATVNRSQGVGVTWTGGASGSYVIISGSSSGSSSGVFGSFFCIAPQSALEFTVPAYVTNTLPAGTGTMSLENASGYTPFTAPNLDYGLAFAFTGTSINTTYQ